MTQRLRGIISSCEHLGHRLRPLADQLEQYLNPTLKGTVFEDLTSTDMQSNSPHREECWLEQGVFKHLKELFVRTGRHFTRAAQPL
jgi:hypothetical protein